MLSNFDDMGRVWVRYGSGMGADKAACNQSKPSHCNTKEITELDWAQL